MTDEARKQAELAVTTLLHCFNISPDKRKGMENTPARVIKMLEEVWQGEQYSNKDIAAMYDKTFPCDSKDLVMLKGIECFSYCEHHLALIYNMKIDIGYYPTDGKVIGISKIARIADMCCKRLQLQERIGTDIADVLSRIIGNNVVIRIEANHACMTARGIKKPSTKTVTYTRRGVFKDTALFKEFLDALN